MNAKKLLIMSVNVVLFVALICGIFLLLPQGMHATKVSANIDSKQLTEEEQNIINEAVLKQWKDSNDAFPTTLTELNANTTIAISGDVWYYLTSDVNLSNSQGTTISSGHVRILLNGYSLTGAAAINVTKNSTLSLFDRIINQTGAEYTYNENGSGSRINLPITVSGATINTFGIIMGNSTNTNSVMINADSATINLANSTIQSISNQNISNLCTLVKATIQTLVNENSAKLAIKSDAKGGIAKIFSLTNKASFEIESNATCIINTATGSAIINEGSLHVSGSVSEVTNASSATIKIIDNGASIDKVKGGGTLEIGNGIDFKFKPNQLESNIGIANYGNLVIPENISVPNTIENAGALTIEKGTTVENLSQNAGTATINGEIKNLNSFDGGQITLASPGKLPTQVVIPQNGTLELKQGTNVDKIDNNHGGTLIVDNGATVGTLNSSGTSHIKGEVVDKLVVDNGHTTIHDNANVPSADLKGGTLEIHKDANFGSYNKVQGTLLDHRVPVNPIINQRANINVIWIFICLSAAILLLLTILIIFAILKKHKEYRYLPIIDMKTAEYAKYIQYNKKENLI